MIAWLLHSAVKKWVPDKSQRPILVTALVVLTYSSLASLKASEAPSFYLSGRRYAAVKDFKTAEDRFLRALAASYTSVPRDIYPRLAAVSLAQGRFPKSEFETAHKHWPDDLRIQALIGVSAFLLKDPAVRQRGDEMLFQAINQSRDPAAIRSMTARVIQNLGGYFYENKNYPEAEKLYKRALQIKPDYAMAHYNLGNALNAQRKTIPAIEAYRKALEMQPSYIEPLQNLANSLFEQNQIKHARIIYEGIVRKTPEDATAHYNLGIVLARQGDILEAQLAFEKALKFAPDDLDVQLKLAEIQYEQGQLDPALKIYQKIYDQHPQNLNASYNLAVILIQKKRKSEALEALQNCLLYAPNDPTTLTALAYVYEQMHAYDKAQATYHNLLNIDPKNEKARQRLQALSSQ